MFSDCVSPLFFFSFWWIFFLIKWNKKLENSFFSFSSNKVAQSRKINYTEASAACRFDFGGFEADRLRSAAVGWTAFDFKMTASHPTTWHRVDPALHAPHTDCSALKKDPIQDLTWGNCQNLLHFWEVLEIITTVAVVFWLWKWTK